MSSFQLSCNHPSHHFASSYPKPENIVVYCLTEVTTNEHERADTMTIRHEGIRLNSCGLGYSPRFLFIDDCICSPMGQRLVLFNLEMKKKLFTVEYYAFTNTINFSEKNIHLYVYALFIPDTRLI